MKEQLEQLIANSPPKQLSQVVKRTTGLFQWVNQFHGDTISEKIYNALHPGENTCSLGNQKKFNSLQLGYRFCGPKGKCRCNANNQTTKLKQNWQNQTEEQTNTRRGKMRATNLERYGFENPGQSEEVQNKMRATNLERYGAETPFESEIIREKIKATNSERYGVEMPFQSTEVRARGAQTQVDRYGGLMVAARQASQEKFGGNPFAHPEIKEQIRRDNLEQYGVEYYSQTSEYRAKVKQTKKERYGDENYNNTLASRVTCLERYGVENSGRLTKANQNPNLSVLRSRVELEKLFPSKTVEEIAQELGVHVVTVYRYLALHEMQEKYRSSFEREIGAFLESIGVTNIISNTRKLIPPKEVDIYLPDHNLAIEFNGLFWHHEGIHPDPLYHYNKFKACEEKGISLLSIFSNSWEEKKDIWKAKIQHKLGLSDKSTVYARKTQVFSIPSKEARDFLNTNHVQGYTPTPFAYGLKYQDELVALMTFSGKRVGIGSKSKKEGWFELVRYSTSCPVVGGASKLLKYFIKSHNPTSITSYSDNDYSVGDMYQKLGFELKNETKAGYSYYDPATGKIYNRFSMAKFRLVEQGHDPNKTERQITEELGYLRVWDCGTRTWMLTLPFS